MVKSVIHDPAVILIRLGLAWEHSVLPPEAKAEYIREQKENRRPGKNGSP